MPIFDADTFMQQTIDAPLETEFRSVPEGEYQAMIGDFTSEALEVFEFTYKQGPRAGQPGSMTKFTCPFTTQDPKAIADLGRDTATVDMQMILDIGSDGGLDFGPNKNISLGRLRAAVGQNNPGPWTISQLRNAGPLLIKVVHKQFKRKDGSDGKRAEVERVAPLR